MTYRDDNEALRARVRALEGQVRRLEDELEARDAPASTPAPALAPIAAVDVDAGGVRAMVLAREQEARLARERAQQIEERARARRAARYAGRPRRVSVATDADGSRRITIARQHLRDSLRDQLPWGIAFAGVNPGVFVVIGLIVTLRFAAGLGFGVAVPLAMLLWVVLLLAINVAYARFAHHRYQLDITADGHFALYTRTPRRPLLLGRRGELKAMIDDSDPAALGNARLSDGRSVVDVAKLTAADLDELRGALAAS